MLRRKSPELLVAKRGRSYVLIASVMSYDVEIKFPSRNVVQVEIGGENSFSFSQRPSENDTQRRDDDGSSGDENLFWILRRRCAGWIIL